MKKKIKIGEYKYENLKKGYAYTNGIPCSLAINDIIKKNNLIGKELEVFIKEK